MIDAHVHFWNPDRWDYPWLDELPTLRRPFLPSDLDPDGPSPDAVIFVEASGGGGDPLVEVAWVEELATSRLAVAGIVAHAPLELGAEVAPILGRLADRPLVKGIRRNLQDEADGFAMAERFREGTRLLAEHGRVADLCIRERQMAEITELVRSIPEVTFVLDHLGKPNVRFGQWQPWADALARLADQPNVVAKLSGLATEADWATWTPGQVLPYLEHALAVFGTQRCMFGGDWPVSTLATSYSKWYDVVAEALAGYTPADHALVFGGVAARVYRLDVSH
jgi:L-fuconolactonase